MTWRWGKVGGRERFNKFLEVLGKRLFSGKKSCSGDLGK